MNAADRSGVRRACAVAPRLETVSTTAHFGSWQSTDDALATCATSRLILGYGSIGRRWLSGSEQIIDEDEPVQRLGMIGGRRSARFNARVAASMSMELLVLRVDVDR
jgi:hypothetical protein